MGIPGGRLYRGLLILAGLLADAAGGAPLGVEHLLRTENIESARFDPSGRHLIYQLRGRADESLDFSYGIFARHRLFTVDLANEAPAQKIGRGNAGVKFIRLSADGMRALYSIIDPATGGKGVGVGVFTLGSAANLSLPHSLVDRPGDADDTVAWLPDGGILLLTAPEELRGAYETLTARPAGFLTTEWEKMRRGGQPTASPVGSGRYGRRANVGVVVIRDGRARVLVEGPYLAIKASPAGKQHALVWGEPAPVNPDTRVEPSAGVPLRRSIALLDVESGSIVKRIGELDDVLPESLQWSPNGRYLLLFARPNGAAWEEGAYWCYDQQTGAVERLSAERPAVRTLALFGSENSLANNIMPRAAWVGATVVFRGSNRTGNTVQAERWIAAHPSGESRELDLRFGDTPASVIATTGSALLVRATDGIWRLGLDGTRTCLTKDLPGRLVPWLPRTDYSLPRADILAVESKSDESEPTNSGRQVVFIDEQARRLGAVRLPEPDAEIMAISPVAQKIATIRTEKNASILSVLSAQGRREVTRINEHLGDVVGGIPIKVSHTDSKGRKLISWLVLPPGAERQPLPTVVRVYLGLQYSEARRPAPLSSDNPTSNPHLLAARGYAVLLASLPLSTAIPSEPMENLAANVLSAVDAAIELGYVDANRVAIEGHSLGGYTTIGVIGQTRRFKAAVASAGPYDLNTWYGTFGSDWRYAAEPLGISLSRPVGQLESGQLHLGAPPWRDMDRFLRNSPLTHVESITTPTMLLHGDLDFISMNLAEQLFTAFVRLNKDAVFVRYWGEGHSFSSPANIKDSWDRVFAWYDEHIGPPFDVKKTLASQNGNPALSGAINGLSALSKPTVIPFGSVWAYLDTGLPPPDSWTQADTKLGLWKTGKAELGYGDNDETMVVSFGADAKNKHSVTYFRREFEVAADQAGKPFTVTLRYDDGGAVYVNGKEIGRVNLPLGPLTNETLAVEPILEQVDMEMVGPAGLLTVGRNTIAVSIHQQRRNSSDLSFDLELRMGEPTQMTGLGENPRITLPWLTDYQAARSFARLQGKKLLLDFTGSDWCLPCQALDKEVLGSAEFASFAKDSVLVKVDFPRRKQLPAAEKEQNAALKECYKIDAYPTLLVTDAAGKELCRVVGYRSGTDSKAYVARLTIRP